MKKAIWVLFLIAWSSAFLPALMAQQPGQVQGTVEDPHRAPVAQASVKLIPQPTGAALKTVTDEAGHFVFTEVAAGEYLMQVKMQGFEKAELQLKVGSSPTPAQRVRLQVPTVTEEITVSARSADPTAPDQNTTAVDLDHDLLRSLPAKNDNPLAGSSLFVDPAADRAGRTQIRGGGGGGGQAGGPPFRT